MVLDKSNPYRTPIYSNSLPVDEKRYKEDDRRANY